jgi:soluble lytic murein transglycosylase
MEGFGKRMSGGVRRVLTAVAVGALAVAAAAANPTPPSLKPAKTLSSAWMEAGEFTLLSRALDAADNGRWSEVRSALGRVSDPAAQALLRWRMATDGGSALGFSDLSQAMAEFRTWPDYSKIVEQAERTVRYSNMTAEERIAWLRANGPATGDGVLTLADALNSQGRRDEMLQVVRNAWRTRPMSAEAARTMQSLYGSDLSAEDHYARVDMFLWNADIRDAQALLSWLSAGRKKLAVARIALMQN